MVRYSDGILFLCACIVGYLESKEEARTEYINACIADGHTEFECLDFYYDKNA